MDNPVDNVNHPSHYGGKDDPYEAVKVIEAWDLGFHLGNTVKYICRAGRKVVARRLEDLQKAAWYLARMIALLTIGENRRKSSHQQRVEDFMGNAGHYVPLWPMTPTPDVRLLRARLIMEEAMETVEALGVEIMISDGLTDRNSMKFSRLPANALCFVDTGRPDLVEIADGCADIMVVTTGTLSACGIADMPLQELIDESNMAKFGPGGYKSDGSDGNPVDKWIKPPDWKKPDIGGLLQAQVSEAQEEE